MLMGRWWVTKKRWFSDLLTHFASHNRSSLRRNSTRSSTKRTIVKKATLLAF